MTLTLEPLIKTLIVPIGPDRAFELFTRRTAEWWPLHSHAVSAHVCKSRARSVEVHDVVGEMLMETLADGTTAPWGRVTAHQKASVFAMNWHPGLPEEQATHVEVRFAPEGQGTRITLTHSAWNQRADGTAMRADYDTGWDAVMLAEFAALAKG